MKYANANPKILVVYYSRSGRTRQVAEAIARASGADLEEIREGAPRTGPLGYLRSAYEAIVGCTPTIRPSQRDPKTYDIAIVGSPTWGASVSSPVRTYVATHRDRLPDVAYFCTLGGRGAERALAQLEALAGKPSLAKLALPEDYLVRNSAVCIGEFLETLLSGWERRVRAGATNARLDP